VTLVKGQSGNPKGRPPGLGEVARLRAAIAEHMPEIVERLVTKATVEGDVQAARLPLERVLPPVKAVALPEPLPVPATGRLAERAEAVLRAMGEGEVSPDAGEALAGLTALARLQVIDDLERRIAALEQRRHADDRKPDAAGVEAIEQRRLIAWWWRAGLRARPWADSRRSPCRSPTFRT